MSKIGPLLKALPNARVLVVGDLILDHFIWGSVERISPEAPVPIVRVTDENHMPGGSANVALNVRATGGSVAVCGVTGSDEYGAKLAGFLSKMGIDTSGVVADGGRPTTMKMRIIAQHQHVVRVDREKVGEPSRAAAGAIRAFIRENLDRFNVVVVSDYAKGLVTASVVGDLRREAARRGIMLLADPKVSNIRLFKRFDLVTPNRKEAIEAAGLLGRASSSVTEAGTALMARLGLPNLLVTRGDEGMSLFIGKRHIHIPTFAQEVFDVSGAGDTVIATVASGLSAGLGLVKSCLIANIAASVVVGKMGTATATLAEIERKWSGLDQAVRRKLEHLL